MNPCSLFVVFCSLLALHLVNAPLASPANKIREKIAFVPASLLKWPEEGSEYAVLVDKSEQKVFIYRKDNPFTPVKSYVASTGENDGPKLKQNDRKTPEGIYFFTGSYVERDLAPIYGVRAFPIDYPNPIDQHEGKGGYGIWFHGLNKRLEPKDTNGCIALDNHDIDDLASFIALNDTPVIISDRIKMIAPEEAEERARELEGVVERWRKAWEEKKIDDYMSFYNARFSSDGKNRWQWRDYKSRLAKKYTQIKVEIKNLRLLKNDGVVLADFDQVYTSDRFTSIGRKRLYLQQNSKDWKITKEVFVPASGKQPPPPKRHRFSPQEVKDFLYVWRDAWEKEDLKTYLSCYASDFRTRGMDIRAWKEHRKKLNKKYSSVKVDIHDLKIVEVSNTSASVSFTQRYQADEYKDVGIKKMIFQKKDNRWKIKEEEWVPLDVKSRP